MILSDTEILLALSERRLTIEPFNPLQLQPNSYDVRLGSELAVYTDKTLYLHQENPIQKFPIPATGFELRPGELYLASTLETVGGSNDVVPRLNGKSSLARLGIKVHFTAGFGDIGFVAPWTLEIEVVKPIAVYPGILIAQFEFVKIKGQVGRPYSGKYSQAKGLEASKYYLNRKMNAQ